MQALFPRSTSLPQLAALEWRLSVLILTAALSSASQGCGIITDGPHRATSARAVLPPEPRTGNPSIEEPQTHVFPREVSPITEVPTSPEVEQSPPVAKIPAAPQPTLVETGLASWYGPRLHGKRTASGEVFNQEKFTAAHRTLPWGSRVKVTNLANGKSVVVQINDRGPSVRGRILDVSRAAARALGMVKSGTTTVRIERLSDPEKSNELVLQGR
jgi:rare lipoprotein A